MDSALDPVAAARAWAAQDPDEVTRAQLEALIRDGRLLPGEPARMPGQSRHGWPALSCAGVPALCDGTPAVA